MEAEREQVAWVFGLTGGELSDSAWHYVHESWGLSTDPDNEHMPRDTHGRTTDPEHIRAGAFRYWYDGAPEWTGADHTERGSTTDADGRDVRTAVVCALYGMPPAILWDARDGARWERERLSNQRRREACSVQLERMHFRARPDLCTHNLTENGFAIYAAAVERLKLPR